MGRDDAKPVGGLQGGRAPARAFADYMRIAVARRPVERFDTEVVLPEWQLEGDDDAYFGAPEDGGLVDENGMPIELHGAAAPPEGGAPGPPAVDEGPGRRSEERRVGNDWVGTGRSSGAAGTTKKK